MKVFHKTTGQLLPILMVVLIGISFYSCKDDDGDATGPTGNVMTYDLASVSNPAISGTVEFSENSDNTTTIKIMLTGTSSGGNHPAHIHFNTAAEGGGIAVDLANVDGATGESETIVSQLNDGTAVTYDDLIDYDGYVNVHLSSGDLATLIAQGDIGQNALTGEMESYTIDEFDESGVSGTATFYERKNGTTLVRMIFTGTEDGDSHPSHIHNNSATEGGGIAVSLNNVNGETGISNTQVEALDDETAITYDELIDFDGYINVHLSSENLGVTLARGDIGANAN